jgi:hypothetical protein
VLRYFVRSGIRAEGFKIDLLPGRPSATLAGSTAQVNRINDISNTAASCSFIKIKVVVGEI